MSTRPAFGVMRWIAVPAALALVMAASPATATDDAQAPPAIGASDASAGLAAAPLGSGVAPVTATSKPATAQVTSSDDEPTHSAAADFARDEAVDMATFLDRLMLAESGGRDTAKNPRSTATGPFQFIESTFIAVVRRHFHDETAALTDAELLAKRTDRDLARRAAKAYTRDNARALAAAGHAATFANLRLAFLLGAEGANRVLAAKPEAKLAGVLSPKVLAANPFMKPMTSADLVRRASREVTRRAGGARFASAVVAAPGAAPVPPLPARPRIVVRCKIALASCRSWVAREERKLARKATRQARR